ncbi:MAG: hemerythrin family protein [Rhodospirillales bacterium]|nr:hemerythrin family protein [Rhodospirillales bacterium]
MAVGVPALDADHRCLIRIISLLKDAEGEEAERIVQVVLDTLVVYCRYHFAREETGLGARNAPTFGGQRSEREGFARVIAQLRKCVGDETQPANGADKSAIAQDLLDDLTAWLRHHIFVQDMAYRPYAPRADAIVFGPPLPSSKPTLSS